MRRGVMSVAAGALMCLGTGCAQKDLLPSHGLTARRLTLQLTTTAMPQLLQAPSWVFVAAAYFDGTEFWVLSYKVVPLTQGSQQIALPVDLGPCLAYNSGKGKDGCSLYIAAALVPDTLAIGDSTRNLIGESYDSALPIGPFEVAPGRAPTIPPIDLSMSRFAVVQWSGDEALRAGGRDTPAEGVNGTLGELAPISGIANGNGTVTLFALTHGVNFSAPSGILPQLAIFENGSWRRVTGPFLTPVQGTNAYNDVSALSTNEVYISSTTGLFKYDGASITRIAAVTDPLLSIASVVSGPSKLVIAGGSGGVVWIGNTQTWQRFTVPVVGPINGVCITGPTEAFATSTAGGVTFRFDGTAWTSVPTPQTGPKIDLQCPSAGQAYVLNFGGQAYRWTGATWTVVPTTGLPTGRGALHWGVASPTEIYAYSDSAAIDRAYFRFNGTTWTALGRTRYTFGGSRPWAVPSGGAAYVFGVRGRLERLTSTGANVIGYQPSMRDVFVNSANSAFAVGEQSFLARWTGAQWTVDAPPVGSTSNRTMLGVWSDGPSNAWAVGLQSTIARWNGASWAVVSDSVRPVAARDRYYGVWGVGNNVWAVGDNTILRCTSSTSCTNEAAPGGGTLLSVWGSSATSIFAVGDGGRIVRYNGSTWTAMTSPTNRSLARVSGSSANDVWAVGDSVLLRFDGTQWTTVPMINDLVALQTHVPTPAERSSSGSEFYAPPVGMALWVRGPREIYLGGFGSIARYDGTGWSEISSGRDRHRFMSIHGASGPNGCVLAVTEASYVMNGPTLWRGVGPSGCFSAPMIAPAAWP